MANGTMGQPWDPTKTTGLGTGEGEVPLAPPPAPKLDVHTMSSDSRSMQQSGGAMPRPYTPQSAQNAQSTSLPTPVRMPIPSVPVPQVTQPSPSSSAASLPPISVTIEKKGGKNIFVVSLVAILVIGLGALGYFILYPMIFGETNVPPPPTENSILPPSEPTPPSQSEPPSQPTPPPEQALPATTPSQISHVSLFKTSPDTTSDLSITNLTFDSLKSVLAFETADVPIFKEIVGTTAENELFTFDAFAPTFAPATFNGNILTAFGSDFTLFSYTDSKGTWLGFIAQVKHDASLSTLQNALKGIETDPAISKLFLKSPGTAQTWKSGKVGIVDTRYAAYTLPGAALNYGWFGNYLIVSASYEGFKEALRRLE